MPTAAPKFDIDEAVRDGVGVNDFTRMLNAQRGRCWICGCKDELWVNRCAVTGAVRRLLCPTCACFADSIETLEADPARTMKVVNYVVAERQRAAMRN